MTYGCVLAYKANNYIPNNGTNVSRCRPLKPFAHKLSVRIGRTSLRSNNTKFRFLKHGGLSDASHFKLLVV